MFNSKASSPSSASSKRWKRANTVLGNKRVQSSPYPSHSNAAPSVWARVSEKPPFSMPFNGQDLQVSATAKRKIITEDFPDGPSSRMDIDADSDNSTGPRVVDVSHKFALRGPSRSVNERPQETDPHKLGQRQKQIDYGKNTLGYERYLELVPRGYRRRNDPATPDIKQVCSKRSWDGQVKKWRRRLHEFDPPVSEDAVSPQMFDVGSKEKEIEKDQSEGDETTDPGADSESSPKKGESGVLAIYEDWDEMEP